MENLKNTFTDNSLTRFYEDRIKYLEDEKIKLTDEARANFMMTLDLWSYAMRMVTYYVSMHKESKHDIYINEIKRYLEVLQSHESKALETPVNRMRLQVIELCKESIVKCENYRKQ